MINNGNIYYNHFNGNLGGTTLDNGKPVVDIRTNNTFTFKKGWAAELNANFNSGGRSGFMEFDPQWGIAAGAQKNDHERTRNGAFQHHGYFLDQLTEGGCYL